MILYVVLHECETWSLTLLEEDRLRMFENSVLRRTFEPKREEVMTGCRKLHSNLYSSLSIIMVIESGRMRQVGHIACMEETRNANKILIRKPEGNRPLGRYRHRWVNIRMNLEK
jgi:hypothetical protein